MLRRGFALVCLVAASSAFAPAQQRGSSARSSRGLRASQSFGDTTSAPAGVLEASDDRSGKRVKLLVGPVRFGPQRSKDGVTGYGLNDKYVQLVGAEIESADDADVSLVREIIDGGYEASYPILRRAMLYKEDYTNDAWSGVEGALDVLRAVVEKDIEVPVCRVSRRRRRGGDESRHTPHHRAPPTHPPPRARVPARPPPQIAQLDAAKMARDEAKKEGNYVSWAERQRRRAAGEEIAEPMVSLSRAQQEERGLDAQGYPRGAAPAAQKSNQKPLPPSPAAAPEKDEEGLVESLTGFVKSFPIFSLMGGDKNKK